jgi:DNA-directed RNA polymerase-3 subunit RPC5
MSTSATPEEGEAAGPDAMDVDAQASAPASPVDASLPAPSSPQARRSAKPSASRLPAGSDPNLLASLPVYLSASLPQSSRLSLFQYPTYPRGSPLPVPDSARSRGLREAARWRPKADRVEVELPLDVRQTVYNLEKGQEMARGAEHGGTFGEKKVKKEPGSSRRDREREKEKDKAPKRLEKTRLESQLVPNQTRYFVGVIRDGESGCACVVAGALPRAKSGSVEDRLLTPAN